MATSAPTYTIAVKGDPTTKTLLDCPFCHRVLLTLEAKKIPYASDYIDFSNKPQWLMEASQGKVPVLMEKSSGLVMPDSDVIVVHLEQQHPEPSMVSDVPAEIGGKLFPAFRGYLMCTAPEEEGAKRAAVEEELQRINDYLAQPGKGPLFGGSALNATDAAVAPKLYHIKVALAHFKGFSIPESMAAVHRYLEAVVQQPAWVATDYGHDAIIAGWKRHMAH